MKNDIYQGETRNGFYIRPMMKRVWSCQLDMIREIDSVCKKYGIRYFADYGTMLGAVREGGYIAWDDDIDIGMHRLDYEKFMSCAVNDLPPCWRIKNGRTADWGAGGDNVVVHIFDGASIRTDAEYLDVHHGCPYVVLIDLFVWDNLPDDTEERKTFMELHKYVLQNALEIPGESYYSECDENIQKNIEYIEGLTARRFDRDKALRPQLYKLLDYISAMYYDTDTKYVAKMGDLSSEDRGIYRREWISDVKYVKFENTEIPVPTGYREILKEYYGDYMTPVRGAGALHEYPYFKSQEEALFNEYRKQGIQIPDVFLD